MKKKKEIPHNKNNKSKIKIFFEYAFWISAVVYFIYESVSVRINYKNLLKNPQYTTAIIEDENTIRDGRGRKWVIYYQYQINEDRYNGMGDKYTHHKVGDTVLIMFDTTKCKNSKTYLDLIKRNGGNKDLLPTIPDSLKKWR